MSVDRAILAGEKAGLPVMVDFGYFLKERPYWELVGSKLRKGDISTHCFRGTVPTADADGALYGYLRDARNRGVLFDVGHGGGSLVFRTAVPAMAAGFYPDSISTDIHTISMNSAMMDLPTTMSKFLAMGMPLMNVIEATTTNPAAMIGHPELGRLSVGTPADIAVWNLLHGRFGFGDTAGGRIEGGQRLFCEMTFKCGEIMWDWSARGATDYRKLGTRTGIREGIEDLYDPEKPGK
jgi:dihydroorotase